MSQPYCKRPKRPLSRSRFLPCRARSASMFSNRWAGKRETGGLDARMAYPARLQRPGRQQTDPGSFLNSPATALLLLELERRMDATENSYANTQNIYSFLFLCAP
jgi:hypothetical protein